MKIKCNRFQLIKGLSICQLGTGTKSNIEALKGILFQTDNNELTLTTNNLHSNIVYKLPCESVLGGQVLVEAGMVYSIVNKMSTDDILLELNKNQLMVKGGGSKFNIRVMSIDEFPENISYETDTELKLEISDIKEAIKKASISASTEEYKMILNSIYMDTNNGINIVGADGYRLSWERIPYVTDKKIKMIMPLGMVKILNSVFKHYDNGNVSFRTDKENLNISMENISITTRLIKGQYPDYNLLIPTTCNTRIDINRERLLSACERINVIASTNAYIVKLNTGSGEISSNSTDVGEVKEKVDMVVNGDDLEIVFNIRLIIDFLKSVKEEDIHIELIDDEKPILITCNNGNYKYVCMPIKVRR
jgi:DNA polymerase III subunit beta